MSIDLESLKKAWLDRIFEGHLSERPPIRNDPQIDKRIKSLNQKMRSRDLKRMVVLAILSVVLPLFIFTPLWNRLIVFVIICLCATLWFLIDSWRLYRRSLDPDYDLPRKLFLTAQKEKMEARIRSERRRIWYLLPVGIGFGFPFFGYGLPLWYPLIPSVIMAANCYFIYHTSIKPLIRNVLQPYLDAINRRLAEYQEIESTP
jgi:hypothetical protein